MVLANKYKQMKKKVQQTQAATSGTTAATMSTVKTTQKQYTTTPKTTVRSSPQTSVMKPVGTSASQNQNKDQNWKVTEAKQLLPIALVLVLQFQPPINMVNILAPQQGQKQKMP